MARIRSLVVAFASFAILAGLSAVLSPALAAPKGRCCLPSGACSVITQAMCTSQGGSWGGQGTNCSTPCPQLTGRCCRTNGTCTVTTPASCASQGGTYGGNGTNCSTPCAAVGRCCLPSGTCTVITQASCTSQSGTYGGNGTNCSTPCPQPVATHGVLTSPLRDPSCIRFEGDNGQAYVLSNYGSSNAGDRIYVEGLVPQNVAAVCANEMVGQLNVSLIRPGFAGAGTIINIGGQLRLETSDGRVYGLQNTGGFGAGSQVYTRGWVDTGVSPPRISANTIGAPFTAFGRLVGNPPFNLQFRADSGVTYTLDGVSAHSAVATDYLYVEGILGAGNTVTSGDSRYAFSTSGNVIDDGAGGKAFLADNIVFDDTFSVAGLAPFAIGSKVYVRGQEAGDYDYLEPHADGAVRQPTVANAYVAMGALNLAAKTVTNVDDFTVVYLENTAGFPDGTFLYVAGAVSSSGPGTVTYSHNLALLGLELEGDLQIGFECAPLFIGGGGAFFLENNGGFPIGSHVTVRGGIDRKAAPCDFDCFVNNTIILGPPEQ